MHRWVSYSSYPAILVAEDFFCVVIVEQIEFHPKFRLKDWKVRSFGIIRIRDIRWWAGQVREIDSFRRRRSV